MIDPGSSEFTLSGVRNSLASGDFSAVELLRAVFERIEQTEPEIHAFVEVYAIDAMAQAVVADRRRKTNGSKPALLGIPVGIKDIFDIAGKPTRCNTRLREDCDVAHRDSEAVHLLRRAGAVLLGKTVTQELAAGVISPPARNPWDTTRIPGGSSGGSAASVAVGSCLGAMGSDTGGSIRIPASVTGTVGLKPTLGRFDTKGVFPLSASLDTIGPIAKTVADAAMMYLVLDRDDGRNESLAAQLQSSAASLKRRRVGVFTSFFNERVQPDVAQAFDASVTTMRELGAEIVECDWAHAEAARAAALLISRVESAAVHRQALRTSPDLIGEDVRLRLEIGAMTPGDVYVQSLQTRRAVKHSIADIYATHRLDAVMAPTTPATALLADNPVARFPDGSEESSGPALTRFTMPWNATGQPVVSVPCGFDGDGLPIGLSFVGRPHQELELCGLAHAFEQATEWHRQTPPL